jgi:hypothetical protein
MRMPGLLLALLAMVAFVSSAQARPSASTTLARDVRELGASIAELHPEPFRSVSKQRFEREVSSVAARAPSMSRSELLVGVLRIIALLGPRNGHTGLFPGDPSNTSELHLYPVRLYDFADGMYVVDAVDRTLVRSEVVAIEGVPIADVVARVHPLVPHDNDSNLRGLTPHFLLTSEVLDGLGIAGDAESARFTLERPGGQRVDVTLSAIPASRYVARFDDALHGHYPSVLPRAAKPLYLSGSAKPMWMRTLVGGKAVYMGFNMVQRPTEGFVRTLTRLVRGPKVRRVVVDVRLNGGGDNTTYGALTDLFASKQVNRRGRLYLLAGRATFSAAANFAAEMDRDTRAIVVGEPTGGGVETYGDTFPVALPSAGWTVHIAARYHERKKGRGDRRLAVEPDVPVALTSAQHFAGEDPVLARALKGL